MKVVVNRCYGGFGLSSLGMRRYAELKEQKLFFYSQTSHKYKEGVDIYKRLTDEEMESKKYTNSVFGLYAFYEDLGPECDQMIFDKGKWLYDHDIERNDPALVRVVEEMGELANGAFAKLDVVEVPDHVSWEIEEYDGQEWVSETHQRW